MREFFTLTLDYLLYHKAHTNMKAGRPTDSGPARQGKEQEYVLFLRQRELKDRVDPRSPRVGTLIVTALEEEEV